MRLSARLLFLLSTVSFLAAASGAAHAQQIQINKDNKTIAIQTSDEASALADTAVVAIGFELYGKEHDALYADASRISNAIVTALTASGLPKEAIQSSSQSLNPLNANGDDEKLRYTAGMRFHFEQSWHVTVPSSEAAKVLQLAIGNGGNNSGNISWQLRDDNKLQAGAAARALEHARQIAGSMADGLHAKLGSLVYASNQAPPRGIFANAGFGQVLLNTESASLSSVRHKSAPLAISPERITRSATVYAVFAIE